MLANTIGKTHFANFFANFVNYTSKENIMTPFLVDATVYETPYMGDTRSFSDLRIVMANSATDAEQKFEDFWNYKSSDYSVSYRVDARAKETLL
jgi:hypothetical protein